MLSVSATIQKLDKTNQKKSRKASFLDRWLVKTNRKKEVQSERYDHRRKRVHGLSVRKDLQGTWMQGKDICEGERPHKEENGLPGSDDHICEYGIPQDGDQRRYRSQVEWGSGGADSFE